MNNRKNQNSILVLATLGVYLGLVLVGATPQVLAQAAMTRQFNVKDEIEVKDDLDKKPTNGDDLFEAEIIKLVRKLDALSRNKKFDWDTKLSYSIEDLGFCESDNSPSYGGSGKQNPLFDKLGIEVGRRLLHKKAEAQLGDFYSGWPERINFDFLVENKSLDITTQINLKSEVAAQTYLALLDAYLSQATTSPKTSGQRIVAENTKSKVDGNKVLLIIHLARASIDLLLASDAK